jgi:hypothetical protein
LPGAHRDQDDRFCGAITNVTHQDNVYVNGKLWAVVGDLDDHCDEGALIASYGAKNVYIKGINVICAVGDTAEPDNSCHEQHPGPPTDPKGHSQDTYVYDSGGS